MISRRGFLTLPLSASALAQTPPIYDVLLKNGHVLELQIPLGLNREPMY